MVGFMRQPEMIREPNAAPPSLRADDIELQAQEGDFIMGYPAMQQSGTRVRSLVEQAMMKAKDSGVKTKGYKAGDKVDILVHNGEMHIPKELVSYVEGGYSTLKKLNAPSKYALGDEVESGKTISDADIGGRTISDVDRQNQLNNKYNINQLLDDSYIPSVPHPESGAVIYSTEINTKGAKIWNKTDKIMKNIFNSKDVMPKPSWANNSLAKESMHNLKSAIENGVYPNFKSQLLVNRRFLLNVAKTTEMAHLMDKANFVKTKERLNSVFYITPKGLKVRYSKGTGDLFKSNSSKKQNYIHNKERILDYKFDEGYNDETNWHARDGKRILANYNIKDSGLNSAGGSGYSGRNHRIKFNPEYNQLFDFLIDPNIERFEPNIYDDGTKSAIAHGHRLTKHEIEQNLHNKEFTDIDNAKGEDLLAKDIMEAEKNIRVVYNNFIKREGFTGRAADKFGDLDANRRMMLIEMAFNMGASTIDPYTKKTGFPKFFKALAHNNYEAMAAINPDSGQPEYHRKETDKSGKHLRGLEYRNKKFFELFINRQRGNININEPFV